MLPDYLRAEAKLVLKNRAKIKLAIFGPGKTSPFFEKRRQTYETIRREHNEASIEFYMIDDAVLPAKNFEDYVTRVYPAEIKQIQESDIILFLLTHHQLSAFAEFGLLHTREDQGQIRLFEKCGLAIIDNIQVAPMWLFDAQRNFNSNPDRLIFFTESDLQKCHVATNFALELFERILLERWGLEGII